ncbi:MAG: hypothetical protein ABIP95_11940 [Pelobium sp.]
MKKIITIISLLIIGIVAVTWLYFSNLSSFENSNERVFKILPANASLVFEYKNEDSFYEIFKDFTLFKEVLGKNNLEYLGALKQIFVDNGTFSSSFLKSDVFLSLHQTEKNKADILIIAPLSKDAKQKEALFINSLKEKYKLIDTLSQGNEPIYQLPFNKSANFYFSFDQDLLIGSFNKSLVIQSQTQSKKKEFNNNFLVDFKSTRNKNSIANLYINFSKLPDLLNNFSGRKNPEETFPLKAFDASASLNINYQTNAFMFSGITNVNLKAKNYYNLFLNQQPGASTLKNILPYDAASYSFYYVSDLKKFKQGLNELFIQRKESEKLQKQIDNITARHSINIENELMPVLGNEFGVIHFASGDKIGIIKTPNTNRMSFLLSTISSDVTEKIRRFDDSFVFYNYLGDPFKNFQRPYYAIIENHVIVANNTTVLNRFLKNYNDQNFLNRTEKNLDFQQYLSNQGNIFYFIHNSNAKSMIKSYLSGTANKSFKSDDFGWTGIYGFAIQFSADKDKFFTNFFMSKVPAKENLLPAVDNQLIDSLLN